MSPSIEIPPYFKKSNTNYGKGGKKRQNKRITKLKDKMIIIYPNGLNFNMVGLSFVLFIFLFFVCVIQVIYFMFYYPKTTRISNYIEAYVMGIESWSSIVRASVSLYSAIAWNNTANFWGMPAFEAYKEHIVFIRENILTNMSELVKKDYGDLTSNYSSLFLKVRFLFLPSPVWIND